MGGRGGGGGGRKEEGEGGKVRKPESQNFGNCRISVTTIWIFTMGNLSICLKFFLLRCWEDKENRG